MDLFQQPQLLFTIAHFALGSLACVHILLTPKKQQNKIAWIGIIVLSPLIGSITYYLFGINRIKRKALLLAKSLPEARQTTPTCLQDNCPIPRVDQHYALAIHKTPFTRDNTITLLVNGDEAFPAMLKEIDSAQQSIALSSYIFDQDPIGITFAHALGRAVKRGVKVYVLLDDFGIYYSPRNIVHLLKKQKVHVARFLPLFKRTMSFINLRNHRKILLVDGRTGFIGGMNIRHGNLLHEKPQHPVQDVHFQVTGPVVDQIAEIFKKDWAFSCDTPLPLPRVNSSAPPPSNTYARVIPDGPDEDFEKLAWMLLGAIHRAQKSIRIMTPYFLPNNLITHALIHARLQGVQVEIIVPEKNNLLYVKWAMEAHYKNLVQEDIIIYESPAPFDHSKIFLVDDCWCWIGSSNWDDRSLFLNFEINLECWSCDLGRDLAVYFEKKRRQSRKITLEEINTFSIARKLRNNTLNLFAPYL